MNFIIFAVVVTLSVCKGTSTLTASRGKCKIPPEAPKKIEEVITLCEDEIKIQILTEALQTFRLNGGQVQSRPKRSTTFTEDDRRIAGCLLQCVYKKLNAVNEQGFPSMEGLVSLYAGGSKDRGYVLATLQSVHNCLNKVQTKLLSTPQALAQEGKSCEIAYDVFECVSEQIGEYCGGTP